MMLAGGVPTGEVMPQGFHGWMSIEYGVGEVLEISAGSYGIPRVGPLVFENRAHTCNH